MLISTAEDESIRERQAEENVDDVEDQGMISIKGELCHLSDYTCSKLVNG